MVACLWTCLKCGLGSGARVVSLFVFGCRSQLSPNASRTETQNYLISSPEVRIRADECLVSETTVRQI